MRLSSEDSFESGFSSTPPPHRRLGLLDAIEIPAAHFLGIAMEVNSFVGHGLRYD